MSPPLWFTAPSRALCRWPGMIGCQSLGEGATGGRHGTRGSQRGHLGVRRGGSTGATQGRFSLWSCVPGLPSSLRPLEMVVVSVQVSTRLLICISGEDGHHVFRDLPEPPRLILPSCPGVWKQCQDVFVSQKAAAGECQRPVPLIVRTSLVMILT